MIKRSLNQMFRFSRTFPYFLPKPKKRIESINYRQFKTANCLFNVENVKKMHFIASNTEKLFLDYFKSINQNGTLIYENFYIKCSASHLSDIFTICDEFKLNKEIILQNTFLIQMDPGVLKKNLLLLSKMNLRQLDHGVPFLKLSYRRLITLFSIFKKEVEIIPQGNRLYYLSEKMEMDPYKIAKSSSKRIFIYTMEFKHLKRTLEILLEMGVEPENIINDWWVLKYKEEIAHERLETFKKIGRKKLMPWMVKCSEPILQRSVNLTKMTTEILGKKDSTLNYLAERLECSSEVVNIMAKKIPAITTLRVSKARDILDYLLAEGFSKEDIINMPRVLAHSLKTMRARLDMIRFTEINLKNLYVLCKSKKDFQKYLNAVKNKRPKKQ